MNQLTLPVLFFVLLSPLSVRAVEDAKAEPSAESKTEIDGEWSLEEYYQDGKLVQAIVDSKYVIHRENGVQTITKDGKPFSKFGFAVDTSKSPKRMTIKKLDAAEPESINIYELSDDTMRVAQLADLAKRRTAAPADFKVAEDKIVVVYRRVAKSSKK